jgi:RNA polymerase sigma-70 factor (ECF subfamily)
MSSDEHQLIADSQRGDVHAFNRLVERYQGRIYALCTRMLGDSEAAADATQDTFLSAYRSITRYRGGSFSAWITKIATNACYDHLRVRQRKPSTSMDALLEDQDTPHQFEDVGETPSDRSLRNELAREIERGLQVLEPEQRLVIILSDIQGMNYDEIAQTTGWPLGTVKSRLSRGRAQLRDILRKGELLPQRYRLPSSEQEN